MPGTAPRAGRALTRSDPGHRPGADTKRPRPPAGVG